MTINGESLGASQQGCLAVAQFLKDNYQFRRNILNGKVEHVILNPEQADNKPVWRPLTPEALNSIIQKAKQEQITKGSPKTDIVEVIFSDETPTFNPIWEYLDSLPKWDGQNHMAKLFSRLPGISSEQMDFLFIWCRSTVAHWRQKDTLHGNECVPTLIGAQGCGKSTFLARLLPPELREYYLDHINLSNKFDKEMALTNNLIVNLDELDAIRPSQQAALKQTLSKSKVNGRTIYGCTQQDREYEVEELNAPYWFNNDQVARIQEINLNYADQKDIAEIVEACFRKPNEGEKSKAMNCTQILEQITKEFPSVKKDISTKVHLGYAMKDLGFSHYERGHVKFYDVVPVKAA